MKISGQSFAFRLPLVLPSDLHSGDTPVVVAGILANAADQQVFLFINQVLPIVFGHLEIRSELNRVGRASLFAETAEDATRKIDPEKSRVAPAVFVFGCLQGNAIDGTNNRTEVTSNTAFAAIGITRKDDAAAPAWRQVSGLLRILFCHPRSKCMQENIPKRSQ